MSYLSVNGVGDDLAKLSAWIDLGNRHRREEAQLWGRVGKIAEENGEAVEALIGITGQNPRKGVTHTPDDLKKGLLDVAVTALGAFEHVTGNDDGSAVALAAHIKGLLERAGLTEALPKFPVIVEEVAG